MGPSTQHRRQRFARRQPRPHLRHHAARRRAVARHLAERGGEGGDRPAARAPRRRRDRGRLPDRLARGLRGGQGDRPEGRRAGHLRPGPHPQGATSTPSGGRCKDAARPRIHTFISTSDIHIKYQMQTDREDVKGQAKAAVTMAKAYCDDVEFSPMDASRSDFEFTAEVLQIAIDAGRDDDQRPRHGRLRDAGGVRGDVDAASTSWSRTCARSITSVHCHDDLGLAVANSYAGVIAGCRQVECAINGLGERAGNCSLEEIAMLIQVREDVHGFTTGINSREIARTSRLVSRMTGYAVQPNKAIVGRNAFAHESGIHQDGVLKERTTFEIMDATEVGFESNSIVLGKHSGRHALKDALEQLGYKIDGARAELGLQGLQGDRRPQEAGHRPRPGGDRLRRDARPRRRPRAGLLRGQRGERQGADGEDRRHPALGRGGRRRVAPATARSTPSSAPSRWRPGSSRSWSSTPSRR